MYILKNSIQLLIVILECYERSVLLLLLLTINQILDNNNITLTNLNNNINLISLITLTLF